MELTLHVSLKGKTAVVTGAGGVICGYMAKVLAATGACVAVLDINEEAARKVAGEIDAEGGAAMSVRCDVLDPESLRQAHEAVQRRFGRCHILINGAGGNHPRATTDSEVFHPSQIGEEKTFFDIDPDSLRFVFDLNFAGTFFTTQEFARDMLDGEACSILNIASVNTYLPLTKIPAYAAAKEAVGNFTKWLATYFSGTGIRVNAIAPGFLSTHQTKSLFYGKDGVTPTKRLEKIIQGTPMGRLGEPKELSGILLFLLEEKASSFITGAVIPVDGGFTAYSGV